MRIFLSLTIFFVTLQALEPLKPLPQWIKFDTQKAKLGRTLFFDPSLSRDGSISCASCHDLMAGGDDGRQTSIGIDQQKGGVNAPTVLNSVFNFRQFWDGRAKDLKEQALGPIENPVEMGHNFKELVPNLKKTHYDKEFKKLFP